MVVSELGEGWGKVAQGCVDHAGSQGSGPGLRGAAPQEARKPALTPDASV